MRPIHAPAEKAGVKYDPRTRKTEVPESMHRVWAASKEGGWFGITSECEHGGQQFPGTVGRAVEFILHAANTAARMYVGGTNGAAHLIAAFGDEKMKATYVEKRSEERRVGKE